MRTGSTPLPPTRWSSPPAGCDADPVALVFSARVGDVAVFAPRDIPILAVAGLDHDGGDAPCSASAPASQLPDQVADALLSQTDGNPLALVELPSTLTADAARGIAALPSHVHLTDIVQRVFLDRCRRLPEQVQTLLLVAAADDSGSLAIVRRPRNPLGVVPRRWTPRSGPSSWSRTSTAIRVRHPLVRSAVYQAATGHERRSAHRALAEALAPGDDPDRQAWHWAASVEGPDPDVVAALLGAATRAERRGGYVAARAAYDRAAELTSDPHLRAERRYAAARNAWAAGDARGRPSVAHPGTRGHRRPHAASRHRPASWPHRGQPRISNRRPSDLRRRRALGRRRRPVPRTGDGRSRVGAPRVRSRQRRNGSTRPSITTRLGLDGPPRTPALTQILLSMTLAADGQWTPAVAALSQGSASRRPTSWTATCSATSAMPPCTSATTRHTSGASPPCSPRRGRPGPASS